MKRKKDIEQDIQLRKLRDHVNTPTGITSVSTDGVTITGDGTLVDPLVAVIPPIVVVSDNSTITGDGSIAMPLRFKDQREGWASYTGTGTIDIGVAETAILSSEALMPSKRLKNGTVVRIILMGSCTTGAAITSTFNLRFGANGDITDPIIAAITTGTSPVSGTGILFRAIIDFTVLSAGIATTSAAALTIINTGNTGIQNNGTKVYTMNTSPFDNNLSGKLTVSYLSGAVLLTCKFIQATIEIPYK